jgi:hypothetical protein
LSASKEIRRNISPVCSGFLKIQFDSRRNQQHFFKSKKAEWLEQEVSLHIKVTIINTKQIFEMSRISDIFGR